jgi:riboflavin kinase/FMN adenylyltransferase
VVHGHERGAGLGYPTANIRLENNLLPKRGVYAVQVVVERDLFQGVLNIGEKPTFGDENLSIEVFLLEYRGDLYHKELQVSFIERLRDEQAFPSPKALARQISEDIRRAKEILEHS